MAGSAPKFSVTGFHRWLTKKPKPKASIAGIEPWISEMMTPLSSNNTPMGAARVRLRKTASPRRSRSRTFMREVAPAEIAIRSENATSTTGWLRPGCTGSPLLLARRANQGTFRRLDKALSVKRCKREKAPFQAPFPYMRGSIDGLAVGVLDFFLPGLLDQSDDAIRHRNIVEVGRILLAVLVTPVEEFQGCGRVGRVDRNLLHQDEGRAGNRPGLVAGRVGEDNAEIRRAGPIGAPGGGLERLHRRSDSLARRVDHLGKGQVVLLGVSVFDVAERTDRLRGVVGNALAAFGADTDRPFDRRVLADLGLPVRTDLGKIVGPDEGGARSVGAMHDRDCGVGQIDAGIELGDRRIVPLGDVTQEDLGDRRTVERDVTRLDAGQVQDRNDGAVDDGKLHEAVLGAIVRAHRLVGGAEGHGLGDDLLDAAARTDRLIVQPDAGVFSVLVRPFGENRIDEGRSGAGDIGGGSGKYRRGQQAGDGDRCQMFHFDLSCEWNSGRRRSPTQFPGNVDSTSLFGRFVSPLVRNALHEKLPEQGGSAAAA